MKRVFILLLLLAALPALCAASDPPGAASGRAWYGRDFPIDDAHIQDAVRRQIQGMPAAEGRRIEVAVDNRVVRLTGSAATIADANRAVELAAGTRGVKEVVNAIDVRPEARTDARISAEVNQALHEDPVTGALDLDASVRDGRVTLTGRTRTWQQKKLARWIAEGVRGVRSVDNRVLVPLTDRPDAQVTADVEQRIHNDATVPDTLAVHTRGGVVHLEGTVRSALQKSYAAADGWVPGAKDVDVSAIEVDSEAAPPKSGARPSDEDVRRAVVANFVQDPRVQAFNPQVEVQGGRVTLHGSVDNLKAKQAAVQVASHTRGVSEVQNELEVRPSAQRPDAEVARALKASLARSPSLEGSSVEAEIDHGTAVLRGQVRTYLDRWIAEDIAARTRGVVKVENELQVGDIPPAVAASEYFYLPSATATVPATFAAIDTPKTDDQIAADARAQFYWSPFVHQDQIRVEVRDGVLTLTGTVDTPFERRTAQDYGYRAGAWKVLNHLRVDWAASGIARSE